MKTIAPFPAMLLLVCACKSTGGPETTPPSPTAHDSAQPTTEAAPVTHEPPPPPLDAAASPTAAAEARCRAALTGAAGPIEIKVAPGPGDTQVVRAVDTKAYPGQGVCAVIFDPSDGALYGKRGERDLMELVRARGWLSGPKALPDAKLIELVHLAQFDGVLILGDAKVERGKDEVRVRLPQMTMSGELDREWVATLPPSGAIRVEVAK